MDTRSAKADLQGEVDVMILEHTLFHAVEARFSALSVGVQSSDGEVQAEESLRLLHIFDSFIQIFNHHHPRYEHTPALHFRLDILEFLVLLSGLSSTSSPQISEKMLEALKVRARDDIKARRRWQVARQRYLRQLDKCPATPSAAAAHRDVEQETYVTWRSPPGTECCSESQAVDALILCSLLQRFMVISAKFTDLIEQRIVPRWMAIACELMLQASVESLRSQIHNHRGDYLPSMEDCFAWGHNNSGNSPATHSTADYDEEMTEMVNKMFQLPSDFYSTPALEDPAWTKQRMDTLNEFSFSTSPSAADLIRRLERLADKYPLIDFVHELVGVMQNIWALSCRVEYLGKPVLVEIEEGHLQSLDIFGADFKEFASEVGLKRGSDDLGDIPATFPPLSTIGLLKEQGLNERFEFEHRRLKANWYEIGASTVIKLED